MNLYLPIPYFVLDTNTKVFKLFEEKVNNLPILDSLSPLINFKGNTVLY